MKKSRQTKRALIPSILAVIMCVAMLIGTTFAWFTDTASTSVNKIQAGKLNVGLYTMGTDDQLVSAEKTTLEFKKGTGATEGEKVLWEPGCTYELPTLYIKNDDNLALKYKVVISGIKGNAKLNEAIGWTTTIKDSNGTEITTDLGADHSLAVAAQDTLTIKGHMKEDAGNEYQGLSISGVAITVLATQDTVEYDSTTKDYDVNAQYSTYTVADADVETVTTTESDSSVTKVKKEVTIETAEKLSDNTTPVAKAVVPADVVLEEGTTQLKLVIEDSTDTPNIELSSTQAKKTLEIKLVGVSSSNTVPTTVSFYIEKNLADFRLYHEGNPMTKKNTVGGVSANNEYYYDSTSGVVTMAVNTFSPFTYVYDAAAAELAAATDTTNKTVTIGSAEVLTAFAKAVNAAGNNAYNGYTVNLTDNIDLGGKAWTPILYYKGGNVETTIGTLTFDGNGHTISNFTINETTEGKTGTGFFGDATYMTIKNLTISHANVTGCKYVSALVGYGQRVTIEDCHVKDSTITAKTWVDGGKTGAEKVGAIAGSLMEGRNSVTNCTVTGCKLQGYKQVGGLIGRIAGSTSYPATVSGNTVSNTTITWDNTNNYDNKTAHSDCFVSEIVGEYYNNSTWITENSNTATDVTINTKAP